MDALRRAADGGTALDPAVVAKLLGRPTGPARAARDPAPAPPASCRAITRRTVLCVVPQASAAPRQVPTSR